jgi:hypothetical protein
MCLPVAAAAAAGAAGTTTAAAAPTFLGLTAAQFGAIGAGLSVASFGVTALGQMRQGQAQAAAARQQAQIAEFNAKVAENNAILSRQAAEADADTIDRQRRIALSKQAVGFAGSNVVIDEGSTLEVLGDTAAEFELDRLNRLHQGQVQSNAQRIQATLDRDNAQGLLAQGSAAASAGRTAAFGTVLAGGATLARRFSPPSNQRNPLIGTPLDA